MSTPCRLLLSSIMLLTLCAGCGPAETQLPGPEANLPAPTHTPKLTIPNTAVKTALPPTPTADFPEIPYELVSEESLLAYLEALTAIQPYSGWRNSASSGEAEGLEYVADELHEFTYLKSQGLELERQSFSVYMSTEIWDSRLILTVGGREVEAPADGLRGSRHIRQMAAYFDSDGKLGDSKRDPATADGPPLLVREADSLYTLTDEELKDRILFLDYRIIDLSVNSDASENTSQLIDLIDRGLAGLVLVTQYSNRAGESRGTMVGDGATFGYAVPSRRVPFLYVRIEDLSPAGIASWEDLQKIQAARLVLDADVMLPGNGGNLIARIPGADPSKAVILGAHIDSPNSPGAFDDGSGSAALLEVARVLDVSHTRPAVDVYLAWFGGHEIGVYGSAHFAATHQELLDRTLLEIQMDGLGHPLDSGTSKITMMANSYDRFGNASLPMFDFLADVVASEGLALDAVVEHGPIADNSNFDAFNVPNVYLGYANGRDLRAKGSTYFHYANHWHDPYETVELAREAGQAFVEMTQVLLAAALETGRLRPELRVAPAGNRRAVFAGGHTETTQMVTSMFRELGMALAWEGLDVDLIPYGQALTPTDLKDAAILILPPAMDYPAKNKEMWSEAELALLEDYVSGGGFLVVTNSSCTYALGRPLDDPNEDSRTLNALLEPMGVRFTYGGGLGDSIARAAAEHPLTAEAGYLRMYEGQSAPFKLTGGLVLMRAATRPIVALLDYGERGGQVLVIADLGLLQANSNSGKNLQFLKNIARYASTRAE